MYSPQLVRVTGNTSASARATVILTHVSSGRQHSETRAFYDGAVRFDLSRMMQLLAPDVDTLFQRLSYETGQSLSEAFSLRVSYISESGQAYQILNADDITGMYGALDQGEVYGETAQRRLWLNYPQTFNLWKNSQGDTAFLFDGVYIHPDISGAEPCHECDFIGAMQKAGYADGLSSLLPGRSLRNAGLTWSQRVERGTETPIGVRTMTIVPDDCKEGTYLRWLNRRGEVSYWLFKNSQIRVTAAIRDNFVRFYENDPSEPIAGAYNNPQKTDFREARELVIGAVGLSRDEYDDLCDLATSPLVERLLLNSSRDQDAGTEADVIYAGGNATTESEVIIESGADLDTEIDGGDALERRPEPSEYVWQRVNVTAGSYSRSIKRETPNLQELEFIIELPERNTIKL